MLSLSVPFKQQVCNKFYNYIVGLALLRDMLYLLYLNDVSVINYNVSNVNHKYKKKNETSSKLWYFT